MKRFVFYFTLIFISIACLSGCAGTQTSPTPAPRPSDIKEACEQVVLSLTGGAPVTFEKVASLGQQIFDSESGFIGDYIFSDSTYYYMVNPREFYLTGVEALSERVRDSMDIDGTQAGTEEAAEGAAADIFQKAMSGFLLKDAVLIADGGLTGETEYAVKVEEVACDILTGSSAWIDISKAGYLLGAEFTMGDYEKANKLIRKRNKMISEEEAKQIALEKVNSMAAELNAADIQIDDSELCAIRILKDDAVWAVPFIYTNTDMPAEAVLTYGGTVMVDAFSGEVFGEIYLYA